MEEQYNEGQPPTIYDDGAMPSSLWASAIQVHEMYMAFQQSGFSKKEALELVGFIAAASGIMEPNRRDSIENDTDRDLGLFDDDEDDFGDMV